jgi:ketosteroid isomerase-like protein
MTAETLTLAQSLFDAIERGDVDRVAAAYADDIVVWHNTDRLATSKADNLKVLAGFVRGVPTRRYEDRRLVATASGFVQQHVLKATLRNGATVELPACIVCEVKDGKITRLDEYFDSAHLAAFNAS